MADYISRDKAVATFEALKNGTLEDGNRMAAAAWKLSAGIVSRLPAADVEPVRHGRWIPVSKGLPEDGEDVLCWYEYFRYGEYKCMFQTFGIGYQYFGNWCGEVSNGRNAKVLAWMPLPEPPKEGGAEDG